MSRADFYIVPGAAIPYRFVCQLAEKARNEGYDIYIHASSREEAATLDDLLWSFRDTSFLPHAPIDSTAAGEECPVVIGWEGEPLPVRRVLINLCGATPEDTGAYERIIEVVPSAPSDRRQARLRYQDYRDRGLELHSHDIDSRHG